VHVRIVFACYNQVIVSEQLSYQEPRLSDGQRRYHGDELNFHDDHEEEDDDELEEINKGCRRNLVNQDEGFCVIYRERFNESNYNNSIREDPSSYERRMQQNLRILSQSNRYNGGETRSDRSHNPRANSSRRSNFVSDTYGVEVSQFNRTSRSTGPQGRDDADSNVNRNNFNNFASRSLVYMHGMVRNHSNFGSRRSSGPQVQNNSNINTRNNNSGNSGRLGRVSFCNEDATRRSTGTTRSNGTPVWGNSLSNNAAIRATGSSAWNNVVTSRNARGWGSSTSKNDSATSSTGTSAWNNVATSRTASRTGTSAWNNVAITCTIVSCTSTGWESSVKNKADSSSAEPSPSKKIRKLQKYDALPPSNFVEYANDKHGTINQQSRVTDPKEVEVTLLKMHKTLEKKKFGDLIDPTNLKYPPIVDLHNTVPEESKNPLVNVDPQDSNKPAKATTLVTERESVRTRAVARSQAVPVIQVKSDIYRSFMHKLTCWRIIFVGLQNSNFQKNGWIKYLHAPCKSNR